VRGLSDARTLSSCTETATRHLISAAPIIAADFNAWTGQCDADGFRGSVKSAANAAAPAVISCDVSLDPRVGTLIANYALNGNFWRRQDRALCSPEGP